MGKSVSFRTSNKMTSIAHNNRTEEDKKKLQDKDKHVRWDDVDKNVILESKDIRDVYHEQFHKAVIGYNMKQKRADRKIDQEYGGYYKKIRDEKGKGNSEEQREFIVQFGRMEDEPFDIETSNEMFTEYLEEFKERNPDMKVYNAVIHNDEATPHMHVNIVPVGRGYKKGLAVQPSFTRALETSGVTFDEMMERERESLADIMERHTGVKRKLVGTHDHKPPAQYREIMSEANEKLAKAELMLTTAKAQRDSSNERLGEVNEHVGKINKHYADIKGQRKELGEKETELDERETGLDEREAELVERDTELDERETELVERDAGLDERATELDERGKGLEVSETSLKARGELLDEREGKVSKREENAFEREEEVVERLSKLTVREKVAKSWGKVQGRFNAILLNFTQEQEEERERLDEIVKEHTPVTNENLAGFSSALDELAGDDKLTLSEDDLKDLTKSKGLQL